MSGKRGKRRGVAFYVASRMRTEIILPLALAAQGSPFLRVVSTRPPPRFLRNALLDVCILVYYIVVCNCGRC